MANIQDGVEVISNGHASQQGNNLYCISTAPNADVNVFQTLCEDVKHQQVTALAATSVEEHVMIPVIKIKLLGTNKKPVTTCTLGDTGANRGYLVARHNLDIIVTQLTEPITEPVNTSAGPKPMKTCLLYTSPSPRD